MGQEVTAAAGPSEFPGFGEMVAYMEVTRGKVGGVGGGGL